MTATDADGLTATQEFVVTVPNRVPLAVGAVSDITVTEGGIKRVDPSPLFADPDGDALVIAARSSRPQIAKAWAATNGVLVRGVKRGTATVTITAEDPEGLVAVQRFDVEVRGSNGSNENRPPVAIGEIPKQNLSEGDTKTVSVASYFRDPDHDNLEFSAESSDTEVVKATTSGSQVGLEVVANGAATVTVTASDPDGLTAEQKFNVRVAEPSPDLVVETPSVDDANPETGATFTLSATVVNLGAGQSASTALRYYRSTDATIGYSDTEVGTDAVNALAASGTSVGSISLTAPSTAGVYYYGACVDPVSDESDTTDNCSASVRVVVGEPPPPRSPDLVVETPTVDNANPLTGDAFQLSASVTNSGDGPSAATTLRYYRSEDANITTSDFPVGMDAVDALAAGSSSDESVDLLAPQFTSGTFYYGACVDAVAGESDTANNCSESVRQDVKDHYNIDLHFHGAVSSSHRSVIRAAADTWETILTGTELPSLTWGDPLTCLGITTDGPPGGVDDLLILVAVDSIDGAGGTVASAGVCFFVGWTPGFPVVGGVVFDEADIGNIHASGSLHDLALHEICHVIGFGTRWFSLRQDPVDTHFTGSGAISAFDAAGGTAYTGAKVPVQNTDPGRNYHWRGSVFPSEVMKPTLRLGQTDALSAITIQSLADLGYTVDVSQADSYTIASTDLAPDYLGPVIELGGDVLRVPLIVVDEDGRVIRVIPPR